MPRCQVTAVAFDNPIPGFGTRNCINLRLWAAKPAKEFDLEAFNTGGATYVAPAAPRKQQQQQARTSLIRSTSSGAEP